MTITTIRKVFETDVQTAYFDRTTVVNQMKCELGGQLIDSGAAPVISSNEAPNTERLEVKVYSYSNLEMQEIHDAFVKVQDILPHSDRERLKEALFGESKNGQG